MVCSPQNRQAAFSCGRYRGEVSNLQFFSTLPGPPTADGAAANTPQFQFYPQQLVQYQKQLPKLFGRAPNGYQVMIRSLWSGGGGPVIPMCRTQVTQYPQFVEAVFFRHAPR
jgi:hypothetical protein